MSLKMLSAMTIAAAAVLSIAPAAMAHGNHGPYDANGYYNMGYVDAGFYNHAGSYMYNGHYSRPAATANYNRGWVGNGYSNNYGYRVAGNPGYNANYVAGREPYRYAAPYNYGHYHGAPGYAPNYVRAGYAPRGYGWGRSLDASLFSAAANGDLWAVKDMVQRGAHVDAHDQNGLTPLAWAAQYGRTDVAKYLLEQRAKINPADSYGFTPLMWAAQEGHQGTVDLLLSRGANPWVMSRNGISALALARYSGNWRAASSLEAYLQRSQGWGRAPMRPATPTRVGAAPSAPVVAAPVPVPVPGVAAAPAAQDPGMLVKAMTFKKIADTGVLFGDEYTAFLKTSTSGGFSMNTLSAMTSPEMETGKLLSAFFANVARSQDLKAARADLDKAKALVNGKPDARFARYVGEADKALTDAGF